jgi:hypothetical protein
LCPVELRSITIVIDRRAIEIAQEKNALHTAPRD